MGITQQEIDWIKYGIDPYEQRRETMRVADLVRADHQDWLAKVLSKGDCEVLSLFLIYNDGKLTQTQAQELWDKVVGEDFVAEEKSALLSNEQLMNDKQRGHRHQAPSVPETETHHWWVELLLFDMDIQDVVKVNAKRC